jgi:hypothetical protein
MSQPETLFSQRFAKALKKIPGLAFDKLADRAKHGLPDYLIVFDGLAILVELKVPGGRLAPIQAYTLKRYAAAGAFSVVLYPVEMKEFMEFLARIPGRYTETEPFRDSSKWAAFQFENPKSCETKSRPRRLTKTPPQV